MVFRLVRGMDGLIYRVPVKLATTQPRKTTTEPEHDTLFRGRNGRIYRHPVRNHGGMDAQNKADPARSPHGRHRRRSVAQPSEPAFDEVERTIMPISSTDQPFDVLGDDTSSSGPLKPQGHQPKVIRRPNDHPKNKLTTVIVEDASDSESDKDELRSVWRNRLPSPGQWMEPVEAPVIEI
jgi:hypothetical protein